MFNRSQLARSAVVAAAAISLAASPAEGRPAEQPVRTKAAVVHHARQWTQPRVDGTGIRPGDLPVAPAAPAVPLTRAADSSGGADWLLLALAGVVTLTLLMSGGVARRMRRRAHEVRVHQV